MCPASAARRQDAAARALEENGAAATAQAFDAAIAVQDVGCALAARRYYQACVAIREALWAAQLGRSISAMVWRWPTTWACC
ncbi:MAG: hypothetical protein IPK66_19205 [Rhodospirillales bacterium]|nr:hypothetical protein [Rhodospirillales bacterium]